MSLFSKKKKPAALPTPQQVEELGRRLEDLTNHALDLKAFAEGNPELSSYLMDFVNATKFHVMTGNVGALIGMLDSDPVLSPIAERIRAKVKG